MDPEIIADYQCDVGENPLWHPMEQRLYWTDITHGKLFRYDPATDKHEECYNGAPVGGFTIQADGGLLLFMERGAIAKWRDGHLTYIVEEIPAEIDNRFNDVIADPFGRVFCGTINVETVMLPPEERILGRLYRLDTDGMTVDAHDHIWSARWGDSAIYRYTPDGIEERRVELPAQLVTSVAFGGNDLSDLYVTTGLFGGTKSDNGAGAGALLRLRLGIRGVPEFFLTSQNLIRGEWL